MGRKSLITEVIHEVESGKVQKERKEEKFSVWQDFEIFLEIKKQRRGKGRIYQTFCIMPETAEKLDKVLLVLSRKKRVSKTDIVDYALTRTLRDLEKEFESEL